MKATYTAELTVPRPLVALMSAEATGCVDGPDADHQRYTFQQTIPVPVCASVLRAACGPCLCHLYPPSCFVLFLMSSCRRTWSRSQSAILFRVKSAPARASGPRPRWWTLAPQSSPIPNRSLRPQRASWYAFCSLSFIRTPVFGWNSCILLL